MADNYVMPLVSFVKHLLFISTKNNREEKKCIFLFNILWVPEMAHALTSDLAKTLRQ